MNSINKTNWFIFGYMSWFRKYVLKQRNNKFVYYAKGVFRDFYPRSMLQAKLPKKLAESDADDYDYLQTRLRFYNKIDKPFDLPEQTSRISDLKKQDKGKVYYFDTIEYARLFNPDFKLAYAFGDVTHVPDQPAIVKS